VEVVNGLPCLFTGFDLYVGNGIVGADAASEEFSAFSTEACFLPSAEKVTGQGALPFPVTSLAVKRASILKELTVWKALISRSLGNDPTLRFVHGGRRLFFHAHLRQRTG